MVFRHVEQLEIEAVVLDLRALDGLEAHAGEYGQEILKDDVHRVQAAGNALRAGQRHVDGLAAQAEVLFARAQRGGGFVDGRFELLAGFVDDAAYGGALLGGHLAHAAQYGGQLALFAQHAHAQLLKGVRVLNGFQFLDDVLSDGFELILHGCGTPFTMSEH